MVFEPEEKKCCKIIKYGKTFKEYYRETKTSVLGEEPKPAGLFKTLLIRTEMQRKAPA